MKGVFSSRYRELIMVITRYCVVCCVIRASQKRGGHRIARRVETGGSSTTFTPRVVTREDDGIERTNERYSLSNDRSFGRSVT